MSKWVDIGSVEEFPPTSKTCIEAHGKKLVICHADGQLTAVSNVCPHAGLPIGEGELRGRVLTCPYHDYAYDVTTGRNVVFPYEERPLTRFPTRQTDRGRLEVELPDL